MNGNMHAFCVRLPASEELRASEVSTTESFHTRRAHNKSRKGCDYCKRRRKKCDELKPTCSLCEKKNLDCLYPNVGQALRRKRAALATVASNIHAPLWPGPYAPAVLTSDVSGTSHTKYDLYLIHHFVQTSARFFEGPDIRGVYSVKALDLAKEYPFIMHAMIAVAACHLQHVGIDARQYRAPEAFHCQLASRGLREAVVSINGVKECDSVLTTAMLLNCLTFCAADYRDDEQNMKDMIRWDWLRISIGITDVLIRTKPFHQDSIWNPMFKASQNWNAAEPPRNELDRQLATFCGIDQDSTCDNNPYFDFWEQLAPVVTRTPGIQNVRKYINAIGGIDHHYINLLEKQDSAALLLFAHWTGLMCKMESWWCFRRTNRICWQLCEVLQRKLSQDDLDLLDAPAKACGFPLHDRMPFKTGLLDALQLQWDSVSDIAGRKNDDIARMLLGQDATGVTE